jgi:hypothetical protein
MANSEPPKEVQDATSEPAMEDIEDDSEVRIAFLTGTN